MFDPSQPSFAYPLPPPLITPTLIPPPLIAPSLIPPPLPSLGSHPQAHLGFQPHTSFIQHPNWIVGEAAPISYDSVAITQPGHETLSSSATDSYSFWANQPPTTINASCQTKRCDICNVDCINKSVFEKHLQGKKHIKKSQAMAILDSASNRVRLPNQTSEQFTFVSSAPSELEMKRTKSGSAVRVCTACNIVCNSEDVFYKHMTGKKHAVQVSLASLGEVGPYFAAIRAQFENNYKKAPKKVKVGQSQWCEVCQISCNSKEVYATHVSGRKHQNNLGQLTVEEDPDARKSSSSTTTSKVLQLKKASDEEMVEKTRKVVEAGAPSAAIRTCTMCNVVCNSRTVFEFHLSGQKHKDMLQALHQNPTTL